VRLRVEVEERRRGVKEVVVAGEVEEGLRGSRWDAGDRYVEGDLWQDADQSGREGREAGYVEEGGDGADGGWDRGRVGRVAGVVLCSAADGDV